MATLTACDIKSSADFLKKISSAADVLSNKVDNLLDRLDSGELSTDKGVSFLDMKNQLLSHYILDLSTVISRKTTGQKLEGCDNVNRLIQMRTYLERVKPIEQKLKYQVEKLIKIAAQGGLSADDPLHLKPNPSSMMDKNINSESSSEEDDSPTPEKSTAVYKPPMMTAAHYEEEHTIKEREQLSIKKAKKRALSSAMMRELHEEYSEAPTEIRDDVNQHRLRQSKIEREKTDYEESMFLRLPTTKDDKKRRRMLATDGSLSAITKFGDISALTGRGDSGKKKKKSGSKTAGKSKKGKKKKGRF